jgi:carboxypeptidase Q
MNITRFSIFVFFSATALVFLAADQEPVYWDVVQKILVEGFENSHIMEDVSYMTDVYGPRLSKSRGHVQAVNWAKEKFEEYGLENVHIDTYELGIGWELEYTSVHMMSPQYMPIIAYPQPWSSPTKGKVRGPVVYINFEEITSEADLAKYRGKLENAIVFSKPKQKMYLRWTPEAVLYSDEMLDEMAKVPTSESMEEYIRNVPKAPELDRRERPVYKYPKRKIFDFLLSEGIAAIAATDGLYDDGTVQVTAIARRAWAKDAPKQPTSYILAAEYYNRIMRILEKGIPVEMEVELRATYTDKDLNGHNVIAEITGTDKSDEVVIVAAHFDGCVSGTGAEDNACGAAHVMEAARILKSIGVKPRRTIRFALWDGHEAGNSGARAYCARHYADAKTGERKPQYDKLAGYYNLDYGTGRIRGIYLMHNYAVKPIFDEWIKPLFDIGMKHCFLVPSYDAGTEGYHNLGLPAFKFCQDPVENDSRTYHSNMDVFDRIVPEYLKQGAVVVATFAYHTAMRDQKLPRKPIAVK